MLIKCQKKDWIEKNCDLKKLVSMIIQSKSDKNLAKFLIKTFENINSTVNIFDMIK